MNLLWHYWRSLVKGKAYKQEENGHLGRITHKRLKEEEIQAITEAGYRVAEILYQYFRDIGRMVWCLLPSQPTY